MSETPEDRPRPTPRPRPAAARPSPRPRVAGSRRDREETGQARTRTPRPAPAPGPGSPAEVEAPDSPGETATAGSTGTDKAGPGKAGTATSGTATSRTPKPGTERSGTTKATAKARASQPAAGRSATRAAAATDSRPRRRLPTLALVLALLCVLAAAGVGLLLWQRLTPSHVDSSIFAAARDGVQALYAYDYRDSEGSIEGKLEVLTGDLRQQYETDLEQGGIIDAYEQVSATTRYEVLDVGLQQVNGAQDTATLVVFGEYVVKSVNTGEQEAPEGSECRVTSDGAQSCTQTVQVRLLQVDGEWKISELTLLTTS